MFRQTKIFLKKLAIVLGLLGASGRRLSSVTTLLWNIFFLQRNTLCVIISENLQIKESL